MSYRTFLTLLMLFGFIPSVAFLFFFLIVDRAIHRWDRYAMFFVGLASTAVLNFGGVLLTLMTGGPTIATRAPTTPGGWIGTIVLRVLAGAIMWALLFIYLTPPSGSRSDTPEPGSIPRVKR